MWVVLSYICDMKNLSHVSVFGPFATKKESEEYIKKYGKSGFNYMPKIVY